MAIMIPEKPRAFNKGSLEDVMFDSLEKMSDDYYVFHSFKIVTENEGIFRESETDFVVFNRRKGIICLEAKAGQVTYDRGNWLYSNGTIMHKGGPVNQACSNKWKLKDFIDKSKQKTLLSKCKLLHAVWFPSLSEESLNKIILPSDVNLDIIMTQNALTEPQKYIDKIYKLELPNGIETNLSENESKQLIQNILCPTFSVFPTSSLDINVKKIAFHRLLVEQYGILMYLREQKSAVINGAAGTGKTMIAMEKARIHANEGCKVLFLCYNSQLKNYLMENFLDDNISFYTIDGLACKLGRTDKPNYERLKSVLEDMYLSGTFPYKHIIIDEGQDFGKEEIEESDIIQLLEDIIMDNDEDNTFYIFYDKLQMVQGDVIPKYISEADCKLTLYRNCRNTESIAVTSMRPLSERKPKLIEGCIKGKPSIMHFYENENQFFAQLNKTILQLNERGIEDIVILTSKTEDKSIISTFCKDGKYKNTKITTCRKFKGLEADAVILIDVDKNTFLNENVLLFYVGTSRARISLDIITGMNDDECNEVLNFVFHNERRSRRPKKDLATELSAICDIEK